MRVNNATLIKSQKIASGFLLYTKIRQERELATLKQKSDDAQSCNKAGNLNKNIAGAEDNNNTASCKVNVEKSRKQIANRVLI